MMWKGVIIEESLENGDVLNLVKVVDTKQSTLEKEDEKSVLHFRKIELDDNKKDEFVQKASSSIKQGWYIHIVKDNEMIVVFKEKVFSFSDDQKDKIDDAINYGLSVGIIKEQMNFEYLIDNPWD